MLGIEPSLGTSRRILKINWTPVLPSRGEKGQISKHPSRLVILLMTTSPNRGWGYYGVIDERLDLGLIAGLSDSHPGWQLVLVGPIAKIEKKELPRRSQRIKVADSILAAGSWDKTAGKMQELLSALPQGVSASIKSSGQKNRVSGCRREVTINSIDEYHTSGDIPEKVTYGFLTKMADGLEDVMGGLTNIGEEKETSAPYQ